MNTYLNITRALSDESRVRAIMALTAGELCVCQLIDVLGLSPATVSKHLSILQNAGLIERRKEGRWAYYRLAGRDASATVRRALKWTTEALADEAVIMADAARCCGTRKKDPQQLAACYS